MAYAQASLLRNLCIGVLFLCGAFGWSQNESSHNRESQEISQDQAVMHLKQATQEENIYVKQETPMAEEGTSDAVEKEKVIETAASEREAFTAQQIVENAFSRNNGDTEYFKIRMKLIDAHGSERERILEMFTKEYGGLEKTYLKFLAPADIAGTSFLSWENEEGDDTQYLYLPALGRERRIVSSQKSLRFVNTDFTYEDMQRRRPQEDVHTLLREEELYEYPCYVIESIPVEQSNSQYGKRIAWIMKDTFLPLGMDFFDRKGVKVKELRIPRIEKKQDVWTQMHLIMKDTKQNHITEMEILDVRYNQEIADERFAINTMRVP